jgi:sec-independent protein translocase protein TatA
MEGFGIEKLSLILVIVLVMFGAKRVPEIGASFGKGIREFKRGLKDVGGDVEGPAPQPDQLASPAAADRNTQDDTPEPRRLLAK